MVSRSPSPEPPEASRGPPGRVKMAQRAPKSAPRAAKTDPSAAQAAPALPERSCRPSGAQLPPKSSPEASRKSFWGLDFRPCGGRFARPRPLNVHPSGEHLPLLLGLSTARPQKSKRLQNAKTTTPPTQANHNMSRKCQNHKHANTSKPNNILPRNAGLAKWWSAVSRLRRIPPTTACGG